MHIAIDGRSAFFYKGSGIGNYSYELIKNILKINKLHSIDIYSNKLNYKNSKSFWDFSNTSINLNKHYDIFLNPHNGIGLPYKNTKKIITTLHDIIPSKLPETVSNSYLKIYNKNILYTLEKSDAIITVSNFSKNDISKTFSIDKNKIHVTYLAPSKIYHPLNKKYCSNFLFKNYKINFKYILYVGSFSPRKNILGLIEAFSKVYKKNPTTKLLIVGSKGKSYETYLKKSIKLNLTNNIIFTDFIKTTHLPYFYNNASCFIYPSFYEGFGLPPLEAMACGTPVITSNLTSIPEILKDAPIYINPYDTENIYEKLNLILNDNYLQNFLKQKSLKHSKNFSWKKTSNQTLKIIEKI